MGIGSGIFLFVVGAILTFAIHVQLSWVDLGLVGYLLMGAGVVVFVISLILVLRRRSSVVTTRSAVDPNSGERIEQHETKSDTL